MSNDESRIEAELQAKGLNAPRLTPDLVNACITAEAFYVFPGTTLTVCSLTLRNGFIVTGTSASASPSNFDPSIGRDIARRNARERIWELEGYLLRERLALDPNRYVGATDRDFDVDPYRPDEERAAEVLRRVMPDAGTGPDPLGFVLASWEQMTAERRATREPTV